MKRRRWGTPGLLACERGVNFESASWWTTYTTGGGTFGRKTQLASQSPGQAWPYFGWDSNGGAGTGVTKFIHASGAPTNATTKAHSVHLRVLGPRPSGAIAGTGWTIGPATCIHAGSDPIANCYYVRFHANGLGVPLAELRVNNNGSHSVLAFATDVEVVPGDYATLSYSYSAGAAHLELFVNGLSVVSFDDTGGFDMAAVSGKPGIYGHDIGDIARTTEWWVTDGFQSVGELTPSYPGLAGSLSLVLKRQQRYTDSTAATRIIVANEILSCSWGYTRIGGCNQAQADIRFGSGTNPGSEASEHENLFVQPSTDDWNAADWMGGTLEIHLRYDARDLGSTGTELVWSGRISSCEFEQETRKVSITGDGLSVLLEKAVIRKETWENKSVRDCIIALIQQVTKSTTSVGRDFPIKYNPSKIIGPSSLLDFRILKKEVKWETADSVLNDLLEFLPDGFVWGVDQEQEFYIDIPSSPYTTTLDMDLPVVAYDAASAKSWSRALRFDNIVNQFEALGTDPDDESEERISATVSCEKSRALFGLRQQTESIDETKDAGILAKYAQTICKTLASPEFSAQLTVREPLQGSRTLWKALSYITPQVAVMDRVGRTNQAATGGYQHPDYALRLLGDVSAVVPDLNGTGGAQVRFASRSIERLGRSWEFHARLTFTTAHQGAGADLAFIGGRPSTSVLGRGWGALYWRQSDGHLVWRQDEGGVATTHDTTITVSTASPANTVVEFSAFMDSAGTLKFYDGSTLKATIAAGSAMDTSGAWDWCFWKYPTLTGAGFCQWDGGIEQVWFFDTVATGWSGVPIESQPSGITEFLSRNNGTNLGRQDGCGCLLHIKFNETNAAATAAGYYKMWLGSSTGASAGQATIISIGVSPIDRASTATHVNAGHLFGEDHRWGGPLVLQAESVQYTADPSAGEVEIEYELQARAVDMQRTVAQIRDQVQRQNEALRRVAGSA